MDSTSFMYAFLAGIVPSFIWLYFWTREDTAHPEPRFLIALTFLAGSISVLVAIFAENYVAGLISDPTIKYTVWAAIEEILKMTAVGLVAMTTAYNDEPIDAMIYFIVGALGFAALENMFFLIDPLRLGDISKSISTVNLRFVGATLLHVVASASIGFALGITFYKSKIIKAFSVLLGLGVAIAIHASFNLSIVEGSSEDILKTFGWIWCAIVVLIILFEEVKVVRPKIL
jgi:RsiW-degrading membrane proteinase PrsW (M82 family)